MKKITIALLITLLICLSAFGVLLGIRYATADSKVVFTADQIKAMPSVEGSYRSINNWKTIKNFDFKGTRVADILSKAGVPDNAEMKFIASDDYFWPPIDENLTTEELGRKSPKGLYPIIAYEMENGTALDPEPKGNGPLRLALPQYSEDETNKPGWVSNLRLIQVGPVSKSVEKSYTDKVKDVPMDEVWLYGQVGGTYIYGLWLPLLFAGLALIFGGITIYELAKERKWFGKGQAACLICLLVLCIALLPSPVLHAQELSGKGAVTLSVSDIKAMPVTSGHYTFQKQLPPYTYYEADCAGVSLSYLLEEKLQLLPGAVSVTVKATDGYEQTLTLAQVKNVYPNNLKVILAYSKNGGPNDENDGDLRLIVPQTNPGKRDDGGDSNTPYCVRLVNAIVVNPIPAGEAAPAAPQSGAIVIYGSVAAREAAQPAATTQAPAAAATAQQQAAAQAQGTVPGEAAVQPPGQVDKAVYTKRIALCSLSFGLSTTMLRFFYLPLILLN